MLGLWFHGLYTVLVILYVTQAQMQENDDYNLWTIFLGLGIAYATLYDI
jgi:hypothetical protein